MIFREAEIADIKQIQFVRNSVKENMLSDSGLVSDEDVKDFIINRGKGWVCEIDNKIVGFSIIDLRENNIWALFVLPEFEGKGIGKKLHNKMLDWYFTQTKEKLWLGTAPNTRAERFYKMNGWKESGVRGKGEIKFEMSFDNWRKFKVVTNLPVGKGT